MAPQQNGLHRLRFNQPLTWKAGRQIPLSELLKRLSSLGQELRDYEQEDVVRDTIDSTAKELASQQLLSHKDRGVKAWTAHCLVDVLRLYAPDAPYTPAELKEIYSLFINTVIHSLSDPSHPYNSQHLYVISSLAEVKSIVLLADVAGASSLVVRLFSECYDILSLTGNDVGRHVEYHLNGILSCMIEEAETLPPDAVELTLAQFLHADPNVRNASAKSKKGEQAHKPEDGQHKLQRPLPPSYTVAKNLCNSCVGQMARYVSLYFSNVIVDASSLDSHGDEGSAEVSEDDMKQLERAHRLLRELWRACPGVLQNVIPQIEAELGTENVQIRSLSTLAVGDLVAGIGAAGEVTPPALNPSAYPLSHSVGNHQVKSVPQSFSQSHPATFQLFMGRRLDKSHQIRSVWATSVGRILATSAGGTGLEQHTESELITSLSSMMCDSDERVRVAAVQTVELLSVDQIMQTLGPRGDMDNEKSVLYNLAERARDRKFVVRSAAVQCLAKIWAAALGEIMAGNEQVRQLLGPAPSKIFNAYYLNDRETNCVIDQVLFNYLFPIAYPALKTKEKPTTANGASQAVNGDDASLDADTIRTERILFLIDGLDARAKAVFFALISRPQKIGPYMKVFLQKCEENNGGVMDKNEKDIKTHLDKLIPYFAQNMAHPERADQDLRKFAKDHDRRSYALIRFCMAHDSDYRKIHRSLKELERKMTSSPSQNSTTYATIRDLVLKVSNLFSNKSHVRPIIRYTQTNEHGLGAAAHDFLRHFSTETPDIFKSHSVELCKSLVDSAPEDDSSDETHTIDSLKACASFARKFPDEVPKDRKFFQAMTRYALHGSPASAAKHAVTIIMSSTDSKQMYAKDLVKSCIDGFSYGAPGFLSRLACLSQLMLLSAEDLEDEADSITDISIKNVLQAVRSEFDSSDSIDWTSVPDTECEAKLWALRILVNRVRHFDDPSSVSSISSHLYKLLNNLVVNRGELSKSTPVPLAHRSRLHLQAALSLLKLSTKHGFDALLTPKDFHTLCLTAQEPTQPVRFAFVTKVRKLLGSDRLPSRFHVPVFLLAFEPNKKFREETATWLRARASAQRAAQDRAKEYADKTSATSRRAQPVLELSLSRFISLLAHHPDFTTAPHELQDMTRYFTFFLSTVSSPKNLGLIYTVAQKVKSVSDALATTWDHDTAPSEPIYILSDLAQAVIRAWEHAKGWTLDTSAKVGMPAGIFQPLPTHAIAQEIADRSFLPEEVADAVPGIVRAALGRGVSKKRKSDNDDEARKARKRAAVVAKAARAPRSSLKRARNATPPSDIANDDDEDADTASESEEDWGSSRKARGKKRRVTDETETEPASERRTSSRKPRGARKSYADTRESDDEKDLMEWQAEVPVGRGGGGGGGGTKGKEGRGSITASNASATAREKPQPHSRITLAVDGTTDHVDNDDDDSDLSDPPSDAESPASQPSDAKAARTAADNDDSDDALSPPVEKLEEPTTAGADVDDGDTKEDESDVPVSDAEEGANTKAKKGASRGKGGGRGRPKGAKATGKAAGKAEVQVKPKARAGTRASARRGRS